MPRRPLLSPYLITQPGLSLIAIQMRTRAASLARVQSTQVQLVKFIPFILTAEHQRHYAQSLWRCICRSR